MEIQESEIDNIIKQWQSGDKSAENKLYQFAYLQLRSIAQEERLRCSEKYGQDNPVLLNNMNNTTALIHDAYIKLIGVKSSNISSSRDFFLMAATVMRQILINNARALLAKKRQQQTYITDEVHDKLEHVITIDKVLDNFSQRYPRQSHALQLKYLMGMKNDEISHLLKCSSSLIEKDLKFSRCWLQTRMA